MVTYLLFPECRERGITVGRRIPRFCSLSVRDIPRCPVYASIFLICHPVICAQLSTPVCSRSRYCDYCNNPLPRRIHSCRGPIVMLRSFNFIKALLLFFYLT